MQPLYSLALAEFLPPDVLEAVSLWPRVAISVWHRGDPYRDLVVPQLIKIEFFDRGGRMWSAGYISLNARVLRTCDGQPTSTTAE